MFKRENAFNVCIEKDLILDDYTKNPMRELKLHDCALKWSDSCAHCEYGFDDLKKKLCSPGKVSEETFFEIESKTKACDSKLKEISSEFDSKIKCNLTNIHDNIELKFDSLQEELHKLKDNYYKELNKTESQINEKISNEINQIKHKQMADLILNKMTNCQINESIKRNLEFIQEFFDFEIWFKYHYINNCNFDDYNLKIYSNMKLINEGNTLVNFFDSDNYNLKLSLKSDMQKVRKIVNINDELIGLSQDSYVINILDKNDGKLVSQAFNTTHMFALPGGLVFKLNSRNKITIMNSKLEVLSEDNCPTNQILHVEMLNENLIATSDCFNIAIISVSDMNVKIEIEAQKALKNPNNKVEIKGLKRLSNEKFSSFSQSTIKIWTYKGESICSITNKKNEEIQYVDVLNENLLISSNKTLDGKNVLIWNYETGEIVKRLHDKDLIGVLSFGFLARSTIQPFLLKVYNNEGVFLGVCKTDDTSLDSMKKIQHVHNNLYAGIFENDIRLIEFKRNENSDHNCTLVRLKRCAYCEISYSENEDNNEKLKALLFKSYEILEEAKKGIVSKLKVEKTRSKKEIDEKLEIHVKQLQTLKDKNFQHLLDCVSDMEACYKVPKELITFSKCSPTKKLDIILHQIQKYSEINISIGFKTESFKLKLENNYFVFSLKQNAWNLMQKYFDPAKYRSLININLNCTENALDFALVSKDKIAVLYDNQVAIYDINGCLLKNISQCCSKQLFYIYNRFLVIYQKSRKHKIMIVRLNNYKYKEIEVEYAIKKSCVLDDNTLILAGEYLSFWNLNTWPFTQIKKFNPHSSAIDCLVPLPGRCFVTSEYSQVKVWNYDFLLLQELNAKEPICDLKYLMDNKLLIRCLNKAFIYDLKIQSKISTININGYVICNSLTPDNCFLIFIKHSTVSFYHIKGFYYYCEFDVLAIDNHVDVFRNIFRVDDQLVMGLKRNRVFEICYFNF